MHTRHAMLDYILLSKIHLNAKHPKLHLTGLCTAMLSGYRHIPHNTGLNSGKPEEQGLVGNSSLKQKQVGGHDVVRCWHILRLTDLNVQVP